MKFVRSTLRAGVLLASFAAPGTVFAQSNPAAVLTAMQAELARSMDILGRQPEPPYFLSYEVTDTRRLTIRSSFGTLTWSGETHERRCDIDLRVGNHALDNTRQIRGGFSGRRPLPIVVPIEDDADAIRSVLWYHTDKEYKRAIENLAKVRANVQVKVEQEDTSGDFSREPPETYVEQPAVALADRPEWEAKTKRYTAPFAPHGDIYAADASFEATAETRWFVNSEGSLIQTSRTLYRLFISAFTKADDGMELPRYESFVAFSPESLPGDAEVLATVNRMIRDLRDLRAAPVVDPYTGPAILSGRAAGVFFHEIFGHRIEGHRQKSEYEGQTFKGKVGEQVLPQTFSVVFDPTIMRLGDTDLTGSYRYDNQGVKSRRVAVIQNGVFKRFLMSRTPIEGFSRSNGHGRKQPGYPPVARQSNLVVEVANAVAHERLREMLLARVREQGKPFGLIFADIQGGFTMTGRTIPNAFNVLPIMVYRVVPDGREELVRGVDLIGTPLTAFSHIVAADERVGVFNGNCGAESGSVPVAAVSPGILVDQIEVQKKRKSQERIPILAAPPRHREKS